MYKYSFLLCALLSMASYSYGMEQQTIAANALSVATNICSTHVVDLERSISRQEKISRSEKTRLLQQELSYWKEFRTNFEAIDRKHDSESFNINVLALLGKMKKGLITYNEKEQKELKAMLSAPFLLALEGVDKADKARINDKLSGGSEREKALFVAARAKPKTDVFVNTSQLYAALSSQQKKNYPRYISNKR